jgi:hypothetical protein
VDVRRGTAIAVESMAMKVRDDRGAYKPRLGRADVAGRGKKIGI